MLRALIFDVDGTLAETEEAHRKAFNDTFKSWGLDWYWDEKLYRILLETGGSKERIVHFASRYKPDDYPAITDSSETILKMYQDKTSRYVALVSSGQVPLRPGVERLINQGLIWGSPRQRILPL